MPTWSAIALAVILLSPKSKYCYPKGSRIYVNITIGEKLRLLTWRLPIGQFIQPLGGELGGIVILAYTL